MFEGGILHAVCSGAPLAGVLNKPLLQLSWPPPCACVTAGASISERRGECGEQQQTSTRRAAPALDAAAASRRLVAHRRLRHLHCTQPWAAWLARARVPPAAVRALDVAGAPARQRRAARLAHLARWQRCRRRAAGALDPAALRCQRRAHASARADALHGSGVSTCTVPVTEPVPVSCACLCLRFCPCLCCMYM